MQKKTKKNIFSAFLLLLICFGALLIPTLAEEAQFSAVELNETYTVGDELTVPKSTLTLGEQTYPTQATLFFPDGTVKSVAKETLSLDGKYTLRYSAVISGKEYRKEYTFIVNKVLFDIEKKSATATYDAQKNAIALSLDNKNRFFYNDIIDLTDNTLSSPLLELYNVADKIGERNCGQIIICMSDVDDPSNCFYIRINEADSFGQYENSYYNCYVAVSIGNTTGWRGLEYERLHVGNRYGRPVRFSLCNKGYNGATPENDRLGIYYDYTEKQLYVYGSAQPNYGGMVVDFDSPDCYKEFWKGFSVGKCRLSVYATTMYKTSANIYISQIDGHDLTRINASDTTPPDVMVQIPETITHGIVGYEYPLFSYTARDDNGIKTSSASVYYNYYSDFPVAVSVKDGKVKTEFVGKYTIVYTAQDIYGNETKKKVDFTVDSVASASALTMSVSGDYAACLAGEMVSVLPTSIGFNAIYGNVTETVIASCGGLCYDITGKTKFRPDAVGTWSVVYTVFDSLGRTTTETKSFTASANSTPVFSDDISGQLPAYFISGNTYTLPTLKAYVYGEQTTSMVANVKSIIGGKTTVLQDGYFTPTTDTAGISDVIIVYYVDGAEVSYERKLVQPYISGKLDMATLFAVNEGTVTSEKAVDGITFTVSTQAQIDFVNEIIASKFETEFSCVSEDCDIIFVLTDVENDAQQIELRITRKAGVSTFYLNKVQLDKIGKADLQVKLSGQTITINSVDYHIGKYTSGKNFVGFDSMRLKVKFVMTQGTTVKLKKIANQPLSSYTEDVIAPTMILIGNVDTFVNLGDDVTLPTAVSTDVICGTEQVTVSVRMNGKYLHTSDGVEFKDYKINHQPISLKLNAYGICNIVYKTTDDAGRTYQISLVLTVIDSIKPEITVSGGIPVEATVGNPIVLPTATATDNLTEDMTVTVLLISPKMAYIVAKENSVTFTEAGVWKVRYMAIDEMGNLSFKDYKITVKGAKQ